MTMGDETLFSAMALPVVVGPILEKLEAKDLAAAQTLKAAFSKVEMHYPGFSYDFVKGVLRRGEVQGRVDMCESLLRLVGKNEIEGSTFSELKITQSEPVFRELNQQAVNLKKILSGIPDKISDRPKFLDIIKLIANAIKDLLDYVTQVQKGLQSPEERKEVEQRKREFVKYSKKFSNTLKEFFKDNVNHSVFVSANYLVHQTDLIMRAVKKTTSFSITN